MVTFHPCSSPNLEGERQSEKHDGAVSRFSCRLPILCQLLDVVDQGEQLPVTVDFGLSTQGKSIQSFVVPDIAEHRLDNTQPLSVFCAPRSAVDPFAYAIAATDLRFSGQQSHLSVTGSCGLPQALIAQRTTLAGTDRCCELDGMVAADHAAFAVAMQALSGGADRMALVCGHDELVCREDLALAHRCRCCDSAHQMPTDPARRSGGAAHGRTCQYQLRFEVHRQQPGAHVEVSVTCHLSTLATQKFLQQNR